MSPAGDDESAARNTVTLPRRPGERLVDGVPWPLRAGFVFHCGTMRKAQFLASTFLLLGGCTRPTPETRTSPETKPPPAAVASEAGAPFVVRTHRWGGGPASLDHTLEIGGDGFAHLTGYDWLWCVHAKKTRSAARSVDTRVALEPAVLDELRALAADPEVLRYPGAARPARAPSSDGVAAEVSFPAHPSLLVDGVHDVKGGMGRLLDLDRELAARLGVAAACL